MSIYHSFGISLDLVCMLYTRRNEHQNLIEFLENNVTQLKKDLEYLTIYINLHKVFIHSLQ